MNYRFTGAQDLKCMINPRDFYIREQNLGIIKNSGKWMEGGICPFHLDKKPGSFFIHSQTGAYTCYSCGSKGSDIISFIMKKYGLGFKEALEKLKREWGV
jgi:DNA primase